MFSHTGADCDENRVISTGSLLCEHVIHSMVGDELHAHGLDAGDFACKVYARQPVSRDAEMHHAARQRYRLVDLDRVTETCEMICRRQAAGTGTHDEHAFAGPSGLSAAY